LRKNQTDGVLERIDSEVELTVCLKNVTNLIINNFYKLEPILIIFGTLYAEITSYVATLPKKILTTKVNDSVVFL